MLKKINDLIQQQQSFVVASHASPDGDALSSTLALYNALNNIGKDVVAFNLDTVPQDLQFLPGSQDIVQQLPSEARFDVGFVLDAGELKRAGSHLRDQCRILVNIDHHPHSEEFGLINYVDVEACATGVMIYRLLRQMDYPLDTDVALCIYTAILSDTGSFRYSNANREGFQVAGEMVELGIDPWEVASGLYESQEEVRLQLLGMALQTLEVSSCGNYAALTVDQEMFDKSGAIPEHTDRFVNYPRSIQGVEVAIFFRQISPVEFKVGFRSKGAVDVGALARELGGGGHHNAAGAVVSGDSVAVRKLVFERLDQLLPKS